MRELFLKDSSLKLTAVFLAFFLWLAVRGDRDVERIVTVPLEVRIPRFMEITNDRPSYVEVTVRGTPTNIGFGQAVPLAYTVDLQSVDEGPQVVTLSPENVRVPSASGLEAIRVNPPRITLVLERTISKDVLVVLPPPEGEPAPGLDIYRAAPSPLTVLVTGPRTHVEPIKQLTTETYSVEGREESFHTFVNLRIDDDKLRTDPSGPIEVDVELGPHRESRTIAGIPVEVGSEDFTVNPARISVQLLVPVTFEGEITPENLSASVRIEDLEPEAGSAKLKPQVSFRDLFDPSIIVEQIRPPEITVTRKKK